MPLAETMSFVCRETLKLAISRDRLRRLLLLCSKNIQFKCNDSLHVSKDDVAMGFPLGLISSHISIVNVRNNEVESVVDQFKLFERYKRKLLCLTRLNEFSRLDRYWRHIWSHTNTLERVCHLHEFTQIYSNLPDYSRVVCKITIGLHCLRQAVTEGANHTWAVMLSM